MADTTEGIGKPRGRVKSCTSCRQVKLRCDALANFPAACSRCKAHKLDCKIDSNFKRISVRGRLEEMSKRVVSLEKNNSLAPYAEPALSASPFPQSGPGSESYPSSTRSYSAGDWLLLSDIEFNMNSRWLLGDVALDYRQASDLLAFYAQYHHEHLPILERVTSISDLHDSNPFLFWTIMRTASYQNPTHGHLHEMILQPFQHLLVTSALGPIQDFKTLQAIIILCYWPNSGVKQSDDPSWQYCGIALNTAMQMGLDQPGPGRPIPGFGGRSNAHRVNVCTRQMTWLACFSISTTLSVWIGLPPHISSPSQLSTIAVMSKDPEIPKAFMVQIEIQRQVVRYSTALAGEIDNSTSASLLTLFNNELDTLYSLYKEYWSTKLEIQLLRAKLYLYSHCLNIASKSKGSNRRFGDLSEFESAKILVHHGLHAAVSLIHNVYKMNSPIVTDDNPTGEGGLLIRFPKFYFQLVMFAVVFLLKFLSTDSKASSQDRELALTHITTAHQLFSSFPNAQEVTRVVQVIEHLVRNLTNSDADKMPPIRSKLGASLMYDILKVLKPKDGDDEVEPSADPNPTEVLPNSWKEPDSGGNLVTASNLILGSMPPVWEAVGLNNGFAGANATALQDEFAGIQWMSDEMFFEMTGLESLQP